MITAIVVIIFAIYAMPIFGIYLMVARIQDENRVLGAVLTVLGLIVWGMMGLLD